MIRRLIQDRSGQAVTEYILVAAIVTLVVAGMLVAWKLPIAQYLNRIAQAIAQTR